MGFRIPNVTGFHRAYRAARTPLNGHRLVPFIPAASSAEEHQNHSRVGKRWHVGHSHDHHHHHAGKGPDAEGIFRLGLAADVALATGKALTGYVSGSTAIVADAAHSVSDIVLSGISLWSFRAAKAPKDSEHPYGHGKFETLAALGISSMLLATAGGIAWHAVDVLQGLLASTTDMVNHTWEHSHHNHSDGGHHHGIDLEHPILALSMTIISISVKEGLYWITKQAGEREGSGLMKANAWHHRADAVSSVVALIGVGGAIMGVPYFDPLAGLVVSGMILKAGLETGYQSVLELVDAAVPPSVLMPIKQTITEVEGVKGCHQLRGRKAGSSLYLDVHIEVDPFLSVSAAHDIGEAVRHQIQKYHSQVAEVFIHIDPSYSQYSVSCQGKKSKSIDGQNPNIISGQEEAEAIVADILSTLFSEKMSLEHVTCCHSLQGKVLLQVQVSMHPELLIRDAMDIAKEAEKEILKAASSIDQVSIQLTLGRTVSELHEPIDRKEEMLDSQH
ncbi:metal tolerance protein 2 [Phoenix dactylifera]|uniref:Metal tolerance protein 2 n=1 Tax=Phoenix dactylifera TaxID=42345 RepID=A0A8B9AQJ2_PHODC|nr:metal tolerance protein 2 [Phoenix dactylifera]